MFWYIPDGYTYMWACRNSWYTISHIHNGAPEGYIVSSIHPPYSHAMDSFADAVALVSHIRWL